MSRRPHRTAEEKFGPQKMPYVDATPTTPAAFAHATGSVPSTSSSCRALPRSRRKHHPSMLPLSAKMGPWCQWRYPRQRLPFACLVTEEALLRYGHPWWRPSIIAARLRDHSPSAYLRCGGLAQLRGKESIHGAVLEAVKDVTLNYQLNNHAVTERMRMLLDPRSLSEQEDEAAATVSQELSQELTYASWYV